VSKITQPPLPSFAQQAQAKSLAESLKNSNRAANDNSDSPGNQSIQIQSASQGQRVDSLMGEESQKVSQELNSGVCATKTQQYSIGISPAAFEASKPIDSGNTSNVFSQELSRKAEPSNTTIFQGAQGGDPKSFVVPQENSKNTASPVSFGDASTGTDSSRLSGPWPSSNSNKSDGSLKPFSPAHSFGQPFQPEIGKTSVFGQSAGVFGQPSVSGPTSPSPFGKPSGFGQPSQVGFGSSSAFGQPTGVFGQPAASGPTAGSPFGKPSGFGQPSQLGFGSSSTFGQPTGGFGQESSQATSAFGAMSTQKNMFAQYAQQNQGTFGSAPGSFQRPKDTNSSMWQARK
jgi:hypothetical protein